MDTMQSKNDWRAPAPEMNHKQLKALAKASRPWYAKKRAWLAGIIGIIAIGGAISSGDPSEPTASVQNGAVAQAPANAAAAPNSEKPATAIPPAAGKVESMSANKTNKPQDDVTLTECGPGSYGLADVTVKITNHTSKRSNYMITANLIDASGTKIGEAFGASNNVEPGQSAIEGLFASAEGEVATCVLTEVERYAS